MLFRRDVFDERGYSVPTTFDEMIGLSERIVADGDTPWCLAGAWSDTGTGGFPLTDWVEAFVLAVAGPDAYEAWARGDVDFDSDPVRRAFDRLGGLAFGEGFVAGGAGSIPRIDFYRPALSLGGAEPGCLMTLGTSILLELIPSEAIELVDLFVLPTETPDGVERLVLGGNQWSMTADTPENRAVMRALASLEHAEVATGTVASIVPPDLGFRYTDPDELYDLGFDPSALQLRLIDVVHEAIREGRVVWDASDRMPFEFASEVFEHAPVTWFANGPDALPEVLRELDQGRAAARR